MPLFTDPYTADADRYECTACGEREVSEDHPLVCEDCGAVVRNVSVPRN